MSKEFNLSEVSSQLVYSLDKELGNNCIIRLSLDVQLPSLLSGDWEQVSNSIKYICQFLVHRLINGLVDIEIAKIGQHNGYISLGINVRGTDSMNNRELGIPIIEKDQLGWLAALPFSIACTTTRDYYKFSFKVIFESKIKTTNKGINKEVRILVVEDNEMNALVFSSFLESWNIEVIVATNGEEAVSKVHDMDFDMILMDIHMPVMNGILATKKIRELNNRIPIVVLTASSLESDLTQALDAGANDLLQKPVSSIQLKRMIDKYFGNIY